MWTVEIKSMVELKLETSITFNGSSINVPFSQLSSIADIYSFFIFYFFNFWGYAGRASHAWQAQGEIPDQKGHGGLRREVEFHFWDASAHQTWLCKRAWDGATPEEDPNSLKKS